MTNTSCTNIPYPPTELVSNPYVQPISVFYPNHVELGIVSSQIDLRVDVDGRGAAWGYTLIYYLYFITINLLHLVTAIASILVAADVFDEIVDKWIMIGIAIIAVVNTALTDLMNGFEIQPKKTAFAGKVFVKPKWCWLFA